MHYHKQVNWTMCNIAHGPEFDDQSGAPVGVRTNDNANRCQLRCNDGYEDRDPADESGATRETVTERIPYEYRCVYCSDLSNDKEETCSGFNNPASRVYRREYLPKCMGTCNQGMTNKVQTDENLYDYTEHS